MKRHRSAIISLAVLIVLALAAPSLPRAEAASAEFVLTTLETLQENYVDPVSAVTMLNAALVSLKQRTGVAPFDGPIPKGVSEARAAVLFTQRFDEVFSVVRARYSATDLAYAASAGMLESLHDSHTGFIPPGSDQGPRPHQSYARRGDRVSQDLRVRPRRRERASRRDPLLASQLAARARPGPAGESGRPGGGTPQHRRRPVAAELCHSTDDEPERQDRADGDHGAADPPGVDSHRCARRRGQRIGVGAARVRAAGAGAGGDRRRQDRRGGRDRDYGRSAGKRRDGGDRGAAPQRQGRALGGAWGHPGRTAVARDLRAHPGARQPVRSRGQPVEDTTGSPVRPAPPARRRRPLGRAHRLFWGDGSNRLSSSTVCPDIPLHSLPPPSSTPVPRES